MDLNLALLALVPLAVAAALLTTSVLRRLAGRPPVDTENDALLIARGGETLAAVLIGTAAAFTAHGSPRLRTDLLWTLGFTSLGSVALVAASALGLRLLVGPTFRAHLQVNNRAAGIIAAGYDIAAALIVSHSLVGAAWTDLLPGLAFLALGLVALHILVASFRALTPWDDGERIRDGNVAAALSHGGFVVAVGLLVSHATSGEFDGWAVSLRAFAETVGFAVLLPPIRVGLVQALLLRKGWKWRDGPLDRLVGTERNVGVAVLESAVLIGTALALRTVVG